MTEVFEKGDVLIHVQSRVRWVVVLDNAEEWITIRREDDKAKDPTSEIKIKRVWIGKDWVKEDVG